MFADVADKPGGAGGPAGTAQGMWDSTEARGSRGTHSGTRKRGLRLNMANNPKKVKDPTEVALSAIQEALNISDTTVDTSRNSIGNEGAPTIPSAAPAYSETPFDTRGSTERQVFDPID